MSWFERDLRARLALGKEVEGASLEVPSRGFSLLELMMCVGLLALAIIFIIVLFTQMLNAATKGGNLSVATYLASEQLDQLTYNACTYFYNNDQFSGKVNKFLYFEGGDSPEYWDSLRYQQKEEVGSGAKSLNHVTFYLYDSAESLYDGNTPATNLYQVTAEVEWWQKVHNQRSMLNRLKLSRLIYVDPASCP